MSSKTINVFYRGPLERSRLGFLLELFFSLGLPVKLYWLLPHSKYYNPNHRVLEPFMEAYPEISYEVISAKFYELLSTRLKVSSILQSSPESVTVCVGFTAPFFLPIEVAGPQIWCINGIPEESLLHRNTILKRWEVKLKWGILRRLFTPDLVITVSTQMNGYVSEKLKSVKTVAIPLCVDLERFAMRPKAERKFFTYSGSGAPWQNLPQLSELWGELYKQDSSIRFRVISRDPRAKILGQYLPEHAIEFVGTSNLDELANLMSEAEVCFLIRKDSLVNRVSFPTKLSEYLASGAWAVVSKLDWDASTYIERFQVGILVDPSLPVQKLASAILEQREQFAKDQNLEERLQLVVAGLGKSHWLKVGGEYLRVSGYFSS